jgi:hypothetical protein
MYENAKLSTFDTLVEVASLHAGQDETNSQLIVLLCESHIRLYESIYPGRVPFAPTAEAPKQDFFEAVLEALRAHQTAVDVTSKECQTSYELVLTEVLGERLRQISKGYDAEHDAAHHAGALAESAAFLLAPQLFASNVASERVLACAQHAMGKHPRRQCLIIAAAMAAAEIERMDLMDSGETPPVVNVVNNEPEVCDPPYDGGNL